MPRRGIRPIALPGTRSDMHGGSSKLRILAIGFTTALLVARSRHDAEAAIPRRSIYL